MFEQLVKRTGRKIISGGRSGLLLILLATFCSVCFQDAFAGQTAGGAEVIRISSQRLEADHAAGTVRFLGEVVATQGGMTIRAEELVLYQASGGQRIERIVLTGSPKVRQGDDYVQGDEIVFFLDSERSIVRSKGSERVKAVFHPREGTSE